MDNGELAEKFSESHELACKNKQKWYIDQKTGLKVLTEYYLMKRGFCCGTGCRHCPY